MDASLRADFEEPSVIQIGSVTVSLAKRRAGSEFPCAEVLTVVVSGDFTDEDAAAYIRFHNAYVLNRARNNWPHQFAIAYDVRAFGVVDSWPALVERALPFALMHSNLGDQYRKLLFRCSALLPNDAAAAIQCIQRVQEPFRDKDTKPVLFHTDADGPFASALSAWARIGDGDEKK